MPDSAGSFTSWSSQYCLASRISSSKTTSSDIADFIQVTSRAPWYSSLEPESFGGISISGKRVMLRAISGSGLTDKLLRIASQLSQYSNQAVAEICYQILDLSRWAVHQFQEVPISAGDHVENQTDVLQNF